MIVKQQFELKWAFKMMVGQNYDFTRDYMLTVCELLVAGCLACGFDQLVDGRGRPEQDHRTIVAEEKGRRAILERSQPSLGTSSVLHGAHVIQLLRSQT